MNNKLISIFLGLVLLGLPFHLSNAQSAKSQKALVCEQGPISKTFGGAPWLVYSCTDSKAFILVSAPGSPAMPFYFLVRPKKDGYEVQGEGTGQKDITSAATRELQALTGCQIAKLIAETKSESVAC